MLGNCNLDMMKGSHYNLYNDLVLLGIAQLIREVIRSVLDHFPVTVFRKHITAHLKKQSSQNYALSLTLSGTADECVVVN